MMVTLLLSWRTASSSGDILEVKLCQLDLTTSEKQGCFPAGEMKVNV